MMIVGQKSHKSIAGGQTSFRRVDNSLGRNGSFAIEEEKWKNILPEVECLF